MTWLRIVPVLLTCALGACDRPPPSPSPDASSNEERLTGGERLGFNQPAAHSLELASFGYAMYVDGVRTELSSVDCEEEATPSGFPCSAPLPSMAAGAHTLELVSYLLSAPPLESARSAPLRVSVTLRVASAGRARATLDAAVFSTADRIALRAEQVVGGLAAPTDMGFAPDGGIFVAERSGRVRVVRAGGLQERPALQLDDVAAEAGGLLSLVLAPSFEQTGHVYVLYTARDPSGAAVFRLARFRELRGVFAERAVLVDRIPASSQGAVGSVRFGADGRLYVALDSGGDSRNAGDFSSFNGKVLRMNPDGTTPDDQAGGTPVYLIDQQAPRGFDWQPETGLLWLVDGTPRGSARLVNAVDEAGPARRAAVKAAYALPPDALASSVAFYRGGGIPGFRGSLLLAAGEGSYLLRLSFDPAIPDRIIASERLLHGAVGPVSVVGVRADGVVFLCTPNAMWRLGPA